MGLFEKFKTGLQKTHNRLTHEIKRIVTRSPRLQPQDIEELEAVLLASDLGMAMATQIVEAVKKNYESQGGGGLDVFGVAEREVEAVLSSSEPALRRYDRIMGHRGRIGSITSSNDFHVQPLPPEL